MWTGPLEALMVSNERAKGQLWFSTDSTGSGLIPTCTMEGHLLIPFDM